MGRTLFDVATFDNGNYYSHNVLARSWQEAVDIFTNGGTTRNNVSDVNYAYIFADNHTEVFVDGEFISILAAPELPKIEILHYLGERLEVRA